MLQPQSILWLYLYNQERDHILHDQVFEEHPNPFILLKSGLNKIITVILKAITSKLQITATTKKIHEHVFEGLGAPNKQHLQQQHPQYEIQRPNNIISKTIKTIKIAHFFTKGLILL